MEEQLQHCINDHQAPEWMTTGRTALVQKDKSKGNVASNYKPITCLPIMWKLLTGIISERLCNYLEETNTIPRQQKGCRRKCSGTKDQLLIDEMVMMNSKREKKNEPEYGMDRLQEGLQHDTTLMADRMPGNIRCKGKHHQIPQEHNAQLEDNSYKLWNQVSKGQHRKRDLPRRLIISTAFHSSIDPSDKDSRKKMEVGYQLKK